MVVYDYQAQYHKAQADAHAQEIAHAVFAGRALHQLLLFNVCRTGWQ
jgi:hypothetical protein